jgi:hypothetical protein
VPGDPRHAAASVTGSTATGISQLPLICHRASDALHRTQPHDTLVCHIFAHPPHRRGVVRLTSHMFAQAPHHDTQSAPLHAGHEVPISAASHAFSPSSTYTACVHEIALNGTDVRVHGSHPLKSHLQLHRVHQGVRVLLTRAIYLLYVHMYACRSVSVTSGRRLSGVASPPSAAQSIRTTSRSWWYNTPGHPWALTTGSHHGLSHTAPCLSVDATTKDQRLPA